MYITKQKLDELIKNAPKGTTPDGIVNSLKKKGYTIEGLKETNQTGVKGFITGALKGVASTLVGVSELGERIIGAPTRLVTGDKFESSAKKVQSMAEKKAGFKEGSFTTATTKAEKAGKFVEQVAEFAVPLSKVSKATKLLPKATKLATKALTSSGVASAQEGKIGKGALIAGTTEAVLPGATKLASKAISPATNVIKRLFTGLGSSLSGVSTDSIKTIASNPKTAQSVSKKIMEKGLEKGQEAILENNAKTILNGVSRIRQEARSAYGKGLETLKGIDIKPEIIAKNTVSSLEKNGIKVLDDGIDLSGSEIFDTRIQERAREVINNINGQTTANGKGLRSVLDKVESSKFKSGLQDPDRMAYNVLMSDLSKGLKNSINESTDKLKMINKKFSADMDLADGIQKILGKVKFKNTSELNAVAKKLELLFSQKGLDQRTVNDFLKRIKVDTSEFKTSEAVRQIMTKTTGANTKGLSPVEVTQQITSAVVTPNAVKNIAIATGLAENIIKEITSKLSPTVRATIIKSLLTNKE